MFLNSEGKKGKSISEKLFILNNFYTQNFLHSVVWKLQSMLQKLGQLFSGWPQQAQRMSYCLSPLILANVMVTFNEVQSTYACALEQLGISDSQPAKAQLRVLNILTCPDPLSNGTMI
jgi:hypothetical protein